jgi:hypothetical protein
MVTVDDWIKTIERMAVDDDGGFMAASRKAYVDFASLDLLATALVRHAAEQLLRAVEQAGLTNMEYIDEVSDSTASDIERRKLRASFGSGRRSCPMPWPTFVMPPAKSLGSPPSPARPDGAPGLAHGAIGVDVIFQSLGVNSAITSGRSAVAVRAPCSSRFHHWPAASRNVMSTGG